MRMNSPEGKWILALVRNGNYAHAGEEEAIDLAFRDISQNSERQVLDVGCGRGGTAEYVRCRGFGQVTGIDIDGSTLAEAARLYRKINFVTSDVSSVGRLWNSRFDLVYLFNSFYAFSDQSAALTALAAVARPKAQLLLFDYVLSNNRGGLPESLGRPLALDSLQAALERASWRLERLEDLTAEYRRWYVELVTRIEHAEESIISRFGSSWYEHTLSSYRALLALIEAGTLGGALVRAVRVSG